MSGNERLTRFVEAAVLSATNPRSALQRPIDAELDADEKLLRKEMELGWAEAQHMARRGETCQHHRKDGGWCTGGKLIDEDTATPKALLVCLRCGWEYQWELTYKEHISLRETGLLGLAPPPKERLIA
jgi:hypothetical protein